MGIWERIRSPLARAWDWMVKMYKRLRASYEHLEAIENNCKWFLARFDELEPEARAKIADILLHIDELKKIWG